MKNNFLVAYSKNHTLTISHSKFFPCSTMLDLFRALSSSEFYFKMCLALKIAHHIDISPFVSNQLCFAPTRINHALLYSITETQPCLLLIWLLDDIVIIHVRTTLAHVISVDMITCLKHSLFILFLLSKKRIIYTPHDQQ